MPEKEKTVKRYRLKVVSQSKNALIDDFSVGHTEPHDAVTFEILEGGRDEITVYFPVSELEISDAFADGQIIEARSTVENLLDLDVIFSGALKFDQARE